MLSFLSKIEFLFWRLSKRHIEGDQITFTILLFSPLGSMNFYNIPSYAIYLLWSKSRSFSLSRSSYTVSCLGIGSSPSTSHSYLFICSITNLWKSNFSSSSGSLISSTILKLLWAMSCPCSILDFLYM